MRSWWNTIEMKQSCNRNLQFCSIVTEFLAYRMLNWWLLCLSRQISSHLTITDLTKGPKIKIFSLLEWRISRWGFMISESFTQEDYHGNILSCFTCPFTCKWQGGGRQISFKCQNWKKAGFSDQIFQDVSRITQSRWPCVKGKNYFRKKNMWLQSIIFRTIITSPMRNKSSRRLQTSAKQLIYLHNVTWTHLYR